MKYFTSNYIFVYNSRIHYIAGGRGEGPPLIMIHGLGGSWTNWSLSLPFFIESYRCFALDLLGFGSSDKPDIFYSIPFYTDLIKGFMEALHIEIGVLIGHSMGGHIALDFALRYPSSLGCVILVNPYGAHHPNPVKQFLLRLVSDKKGGIRFINDLTIRLAIERLFYRRGSTCKEMVKFYRDLSRSSQREALSRAFTRTAKSMLTYSLRHKLHDIKIPALIIAGKNDRVIPPRDTIYMRQSIPHAKLVTLDACGHMAHLERPEVFAKLVLDFLQSEALFESRP